jgi:hypothetical protein
MYSVRCSFWHFFRPKKCSGESFISAKNMKTDTPVHAMDLYPNGPGSDASQRGRKLTQKIEYRSRRGEEPEFWEQGHNTKGFSWTDVPQALSMLFVDYLIWDKTGRQDQFYFTGACNDSHAATLGDAIYSGGPIQELLAGTEAVGKPVKPHAKKIFYGDNVHGRAVVERDRKITVSLNFLPPDCVEIIWQPRGKEPLSKIADLQLLARRLRLSLNLPIPASLATGEESQPKKTEPPKKETPPEPDKAKRAQPKPVETPPLYKLEDFPECDKWREGIYIRIHQGMKPDEIFNSPTMQNEKTTLERVTNYCNTLIRLLHPADGSILPEQFTVFPTDYEWTNDMPIWSAGGGTWTLNDVTQGTLILGATGSGKTSCSGRTIAKAFLAKQFGGLILTTKPGEGKEWTLFCNAIGREDAVRWVRFDGPNKFNLLAYETQRPGAGAQLTENLIGFFKVLISVMGYRHGQRTNEGFWQSAGNQLLRNLFDLFLIAQTPLSLDRLAEFVAAAPTKKTDDEEAWRDVPLFGEIIAAAENNSTKPADRRVVDKAKAYWLIDYPRLAPETRSCITFGFNAMLDAMRSRHIYELLCTETTITPEAVFNGQIIILDLPVKDFGDAGVLVQCAFKYMFQRAIERRENLGDQTRPAFLFIDEAQNFFTEYDTVFQQTARSSRVATVLLSQNINNFYSHLGGDSNARHMFDSLAGNLNTRIFHANGDNLTNEWASKMFGSWDKPISSTSASTNPHESMNLFADQAPTIGHGMTTRREPVVPPEDFAKLQSSTSKYKYLSEAYVFRVGSTFEETGLPFIRTAFQQTRIQETKEPSGPVPPVLNQNQKGK